MISVVASDEEQQVVREFFELFKTPWKFYSTGEPVKILLCSGVEPPANNAALVIIFAGNPLDFDKDDAVRYEAKTGAGRIQFNDVELPVYASRLVEKSSQKVVFQRHQTGDKMVIRVGFDLFAEARLLLTVGQPEAQAGMPTLEQHIIFLRELILSHGIPLVEIPPRPVGYEFIACLTHDVDHVGIRNHKFDHTMFGFLYRATAGSLLDVCTGKRSVGQLGQNLFAALRLPFVHLGLVRDFWYQFDHYTALENGRPSTFYVIPKKGEAGLDAHGRRVSQRAASYDAAELREILQKLESAGKEVTVHGLDAWRDTAAGRDERSRIGSLVNHKAAGIRMHWLYFDAGAPEKLEAAGFDYDSTVGYNATIGYRAGTAQVFKPLTTNHLLELPMHIMDTALFYPSYLNLSPKQAEQVMRPLIENAARFGGVLTINWHDRSVAPERLWGETYQWLIHQMQEKKAWFATAAQTVAWFRMRRSATFEVTDTGRIKINLPDADTKTLPSLRVKIYCPRGAEPQVLEEIASDGWETSLAA